MAKTVKPFRFKVALSFPGEHRGRVERIAYALVEKLGRGTVLYDRWFSAEFARPNLDTYLPKLYLQSRLLVFFFGDAYSKKEWCGLEWRAGRDLLKRRQDDRLMFVRFDDSETSGLFSVDGYLDARKSSDGEIVSAILKRIEIVTPPIVSQLDTLIRVLRTQTLPDIQNRCGRIRILTMERPIELGGIYTDVNLLERRAANLRRTKEELIASAEPNATDRFGISQLVTKRVQGRLALERYQRLMIYGKPGAGKTTFLKRIAMECASGSLRAEMVPSFITLKDFAEAEGSPALLDYKAPVEPE